MQKDTNEKAPSGVNRIHNNELVNSVRRKSSKVDAPIRYIVCGGTKMNLTNEIEKAPLQSKKFIAYIAANLTMKLLLFYMTYKNEGDLVIMTGLTASTFLDIGYILGQTALDRYVRVASIARPSGAGPGRPKS